MYVFNRPQLASSLAVMLEVSPVQICEGSSRSAHLKGEEKLSP